MLILPGQATIDDLEPLLASLQSAWQAEAPGALTIDCGKLTSMDSAGAVALAIALDRSMARGVNLELLRPPPIFGAFGSNASGDHKRPFGAKGLSAPDVFPVSRVTHTNSLDLVANSFSPWIGGRLSLSSAALEPVRVFLKELFRNIEDHAGVDVGYLAAQFIPGKDRVDIAIGDGGVGIPGRIRRKEPGIGDAAALSKAFEEGFSTKTTPGNRGAGLNWVKSVVVDSNRGALRLASGRGRLHVAADEGFSIHAITERSASFPGALYSISLRTDTIEAVEETRGELEW
ncbi:MAG: STAS domain-containing protein [Tagaea sp.]|nr:STAS domain-containing protein [Tagaea sp.]